MVLGLCKVNGWHIVLIGFNDRANLHLLSPLYINVGDPELGLQFDPDFRGSDPNLEPGQKSL